MPDYVVIATWPFGRTAVEKAFPLLEAGRPALDAAIAGAQAVEDDPKVHSVGFAGLGNAVGTVQLDACVMDGKTLACGAVAGLENVRHPAALARRVMERTPHVLLVGAGAKEFAIKEGFPLETLLTPESVAEWEKARPKPHPVPAPSDLPGAPKSGGGGPPETHDTVAVLALDRKGNLGGVCTTSGLAHKLPGRVGDSPLIGHGLYVDDSAGAAGGTGVGEEVIRIGGSLLIVEALRAGKTPQEACEQAVRRLNAVAVRRGVHPASVAFLSLDPKGRIGAACTQRTTFQYAVAIDGKVEMRTAPQIAPGS
jgi:isoaspartyl peptidase/L-asparaginase-like protein (Ntn-hydrolase superfamily)